MIRAALATTALALLLIPVSSSATVFRVDYVTDGDSIVLRNGQRVR